MCYGVEDNIWSTFKIIDPQMNFQMGYIFLKS